MAWIRILTALTLTIGNISFAFAASTQTEASLPAVGTKTTVGTVSGLTIEAIVQSPSGQSTPLQVVCLFEYTDGDIYKSPPALPAASNGMVHVDEALHGLITDIRKSNRFEGKSLETLLITPPTGTILAEKLLLIGLGNRSDFKPEDMRMVGVIGMREALRLGVGSYSHASDLKDAGISSPTSAVAGYVVRGAVQALRTQQYLVTKSAGASPTVKRLTLLTGPAYFEDSNSGITQAIDELAE